MTVVNGTYREIKGTVGEGTVLDFGRRVEDDTDNNTRVFVGGTFAGASLAFQLSPDRGKTWFAVASAMTAPGTFVIPVTHMCNLGIVPTALAAGTDLKVWVI